MYTLGIQLVPEPSLKTSDTLYTHDEILVISTKKSFALISFQCLLILYLNIIDLLSICMKTCHTKQFGMCFVLLI